jgi:hypothetical protein
MRRFRYDLIGNAKLFGRKLALRTSYACLLCILSAFESTTAQAQPSNSQLGATDYAELADCKQFIPIAKELNERIVDYISSPRSAFKCSSFGRTTWEGSKKYSIIRVANPKFCHENYCYTVVYDDRANSIVFSIDTENLIDQFKHAKDHILSLNNILNHRFENTSNGILLRVRDGWLAISAVNEILTISIVPVQKGGK